MGMDSQLSSVRRSSEIEECVIIREYAQRERERRRASKQPRAQAPVVIFFFLCRRRLAGGETRSLRFSSLSLYSSIYKAMMDDHIALKEAKRERGRARGRTHSPFFRIERFTRGRERARALAYSRERTSKRIIMRRRMFNRGQNERDREREKSSCLIFELIRISSPVHREREEPRNHHGAQILSNTTNSRRYLF